MSYKTHNNPWCPPPPSDLMERALLHVASQQARCARGEHDEREARKNYVTYVGPPGRKRQVPPGTRYCGFCHVILPVAEAQEGSA